MQEPSPFQLSIMVQGTEVGKLARDLFPNGVLIDEDYKNLPGALDHTNTALKSNWLYEYLSGSSIINAII